VGRRGLLSVVDKLMLFVLFLESCMPTAQNLVMIHALEGRQESATRLARIMLMIYGLSSLPISLLLTVFLNYVKL
jgi:predicted permease